MELGNIAEGLEIIKGHILEGKKHFEKIKVDKVARKFESVIEWIEEEYTQIEKEVENIKMKEVSEKYQLEEI